MSCKIQSRRLMIDVRAMRRAQEDSLAAHDAQANTVINELRTQTKQLRALVDALSTAEVTRE